MSKREFNVKATQQEFIKKLTSDIIEAAPVIEGEAIYALQCTHPIGGKLELNIIGLPLPVDMLEKAPSLSDKLTRRQLEYIGSDGKFLPIILVEMLQFGDLLNVKMNWDDYLDSYAPKLIDPLINKLPTGGYGPGLSASLEAYKPTLAEGDSFESTQHHTPPRETPINVHFDVLDATIRSRLYLKPIEESPLRTLFNLIADSCLAPFGKWELRGLSDDKSLLIHHLPIPSWGEVVALEERSRAYNKTPEELNQLKGILGAIYGEEKEESLSELKELPVVDRALRLFEGISVVDLPLELQRTVKKHDPPYMLPRDNSDADRIRRVEAKLSQKCDELILLREKYHKQKLEKLWHYLKEDGILTDTNNRQPATATAGDNGRNQAGNELLPPEAPRDDYRKWIDYFFKLKELENITFKNFFTKIWGYSHRQAYYYKNLYEAEFGKEPIQK